MSSGWATIASAFDQSSGNGLRYGGACSVMGPSRVASCTPRACHRALRPCGRHGVTALSCPPAHAFGSRLKKRPQRWKVKSYRPAMPNLSDFDRLVVRRFSGGLTPDVAADVDKAGGGRARFVQQLRPGTLADPDGGMVDGWFPSPTPTPAELFARQQDGTQGAWEVMWDLSRWSVARRIHSRRALLEVMTDFWSNLLNVPITHDSACFHRIAYDQTIRRFALTSFEKLLKHTITHPA